MLLDPWSIQDRVYFSVLVGVDHGVLNLGGLREKLDDLRLSYVLWWRLQRCKSLFGRYDLCLVVAMRSFKSFLQEFEDGVHFGVPAGVGYGLLNLKDSSEKLDHLRLAYGLWW